MKLVVFAGNQPRHLYVVSRLLEKFPELRLLLMTRESMQVVPPDDCAPRDRELLLKHFVRRAEVEERAFTSSSESLRIYESAFQVISPTDLNGPETARMVTDFNPDTCVVFGTDLIKSPVLEVLPRETFNVHLGLSPWYRGSATLFWPFYFMEPQWQVSPFIGWLRRLTTAKLYSRPFRNFTRIWEFMMWRAKQSLRPVTSFLKC